jgi:hypothetical protein
VVSDHDSTPWPPLCLVTLTSSFPEILFALYVDRPSHEGSGNGVESPGDVEVGIKPSSTYRRDECDKYRPYGHSQEGDCVYGCPELEPNGRHGYTQVSTID